MAFFIELKSIVTAAAAAIYILTTALALFTRRRRSVVIVVVVGVDHDCCIAVEVFERVGRVGRSGGRMSHVALDDW